MSHSIIAEFYIIMKTRLNKVLVELAEQLTKSSELEDLLGFSPEHFKIEIDDLDDSLSISVLASTSALKVPSPLSDSVLLEFIEFLNSSLLEPLEVLKGDGGTSFEFIDLNEELYKKLRSAKVLLKLSGSEGSASCEINQED